MSEARAILSGDVVDLINVTSLDSTSVKISWEIINGKYVEGFYIYAKNMDDTVNNDYESLTVLASGSSSCRISGLKKFTTYEFFIVPFYKSIEGKPSNSRISKTLEDGEYLKKS
jgi:roundabout axon guidance receptor 2